jgi:hypothetical protein
MKKIILPMLITVAILLCGCASNVVPMGRDTFMVEHGGWPDMNESSLEAKCFREANAFCEKKGLVMVPVSINGTDGRVFANNASCKVVFLAVPPNDPRNAPPHLERSPDAVTKQIIIKKEQ